MEYSETEEDAKNDVLSLLRKIQKYSVQKRICLWQFGEKWLRSWEKYSTPTLFEVIYFICSG